MILRLSQRTAIESRTEVTKDWDGRNEEVIVNENINDDGEI